MDGTEDDATLSVLSGDMDNLPPQRSQIVRVFISSTFTDTQAERNTIMKDIYSRLKDYCRNRHGIDFQLVDMRWGIRDEAFDDHSTSDLCLKEIQLCQKISAGPNFVAILGQKYGYRPFPSVIPATEFENIRECLVSHQQSVELLDEWFIKDNNASPPLYSLKRISSILNNFKNSSNPQLQNDDRIKWQNVYSNLRQLLTYAVKRLLQDQKMDEKRVENYQISVTQQEIQHGILSVNDSIDCRCACFVRKICNIEMDLSNKSVAQYLDIAHNRQQIDQEAADLLTSLRETKVYNKLRESRIFQFQLDWSPNGIDPDNVAEHRQYLENFNEKFFSSMMTMIDDGVEKTNQLQIDDSLYEEVLGHLYFGQKHCLSFHGRTDVLESIEKYIDPSCNSINDDSNNYENRRCPFIIYGASGSGKTSIMAKCAQDIKHKYPSAKLIIRFLGTSPASSSIRKLLASLCFQISRLYDKDLNKVPSEYSQLIAYFATLLSDIPSSKPLIILLDSLDQLLPLDGAHRMSWIPRCLPSSVSLVLSTLPLEYNCLHTLQLVLPIQTAFLEILPLSVNMSEEIINDWLKLSSRTVTDSQHKIIANAVSACSLPLYLKLVFDLVIDWRSYDTVMQSDLPSTIPEMISALFDRLEINHGKTLVARALAFITATKSGLTESELEDLLSLDDIVLQDVYQYWLPPIRRIPPLLWTRIRNDISEYIVERDADGSLVIYWYHRQFIEVARQRYLGNEEVKKEIHSLCADYYLGKWADKDKPFQYTSKQVELFNLDNSESQADRKVPKQPLKFEAEGEINIGKTKYNRRKLSELPYHLVHAGRMDEAKKKIFCSYEWLLTKLKATSIQEVLNDFILAMEIEKDIELKIVYDMIRMAATTIIANPFDLAPEITGQLFNLANEKYPSITQLVHAAQLEGARSVPLMPLRSCFPPPGGLLRSTLEGHTEAVLSLTVSNGEIFLATGSVDKTIRLWDLHSGILIHVLKGHPEPIHRVHISNDNRMVIAYSYIGRYRKVNSIGVWNLESGEHMYNLKGHTGGKCQVALTHDSRYALSGCQVRAKLCNMLPMHKVHEAKNAADGSEQNNTHAKSEKEVPEGEENEDKGSSSDTDNSLEINQLSDDDYNEPDNDAGKRDKNKIFVVLVWSLENGKLVKWMYGHKDEICDITVASRDQFAVTSSRDKSAKVWNLQNYTCLRVITEPRLRGIMERICLTPDDRYVIIEALHVGIYSVETGELLHELNDPKYSSTIESFNISSDSKFLLTTDVGNRIKWYDLENGKFLRRIEGHEGKSGMRYGEIVPNTNYVLTSLGTTTANVWDISDGTLYTTLEGHTDKITSSIIAGDNYELLAITASEDKTVKIWSLSNLDTIQEDKFLDHHKSSVTFIYVAKNGRYYITGSTDKTIKKWDMDSGNLIKEVEVAIGVIYSILVMPDGGTGFAFPSQKSVRLTIDLELFEIVETAKLNFVHIMCGCISYDGKLIMGVTYDQTLKVWKTCDFTLVTEQKKPHITNIISLQSNYFLTIYCSKMYDGSGDTKIIKAWNFNRSGNSIKLEGHTDRIQCFTLTDDERYLLSGARDKSVIIWDLSNLRVYGKLQGHDDTVRCIAVTSTARLAASGSADTTVRLWDFSSSNCPVIHTYNGHNHVVTDVTFSPNNTYIISFSSEETVAKVWSVTTGNLMADFHMHAKMEVYRIDETSHRMIIGANDGRVMLLSIHDLFRKRAGTKVVGWKDLKGRKKYRPKIKRQESAQEEDKATSEDNNQTVENGINDLKPVSLMRHESKASINSKEGSKGILRNSIITPPPEVLHYDGPEITRSACCTIS